MSEAIEPGAGGVDAQLADIDQLLEQAPAPDQPGAPGNAVPVPEIDPAAAVTSLVAMIFQLAAFRAGPHWLLHDKEAEMLGGATAAVIAKYSSTTVIGPEAALVLVAGMIVGPRLVKQFGPADVQPSTDAASGDQRKSRAA